MSDRLALIDKMIASGRQDAFTYYARAMELRSVGRLDDAMHAYEVVAERFPDYVPTFLMAGQVAEELDRSPESAEWYRRGLVIAEQAGDGHAAGELRAALSALA